MFFFDDWESLQGQKIEQVFFKNFHGFVALSMQTAAVLFLGNKEHI